jgi:hypothetical protein
MATFKSLPIGSTFRFSSEREFPYSGMMRGPWVKTSQRGYTHKDSGGKYKVGTVSTKVDSTEQNPGLNKWVKASAVRIRKVAGKVLVDVKRAVSNPRKRKR